MYRPRFRQTSHATRRERAPCKRSFSRRRAAMATKHSMRTKPRGRAGNALEQRAPRHCSAHRIERTSSTFTYGEQRAGCCEITGWDANKSAAFHALSACVHLLFRLTQHCSTHRQAGIGIGTLSAPLSTAQFLPSVLSTASALPNVAFEHVQRDQRTGDT